MTRQMIALALLTGSLAPSQHTQKGPVMICDVPQHLAKLAKKVVAVRGRLVATPESGRTDSFYIDELTGQCKSDQSHPSEIVRIALFEWPERGRPIPQGYQYDGKSITAVRKILAAQRRQGGRGAVLVTILGVLTVGENHAEMWVRQTGLKDVLANRPYPAELLYFAMKDPVPATRQHDKEE